MQSEKQSNIILMGWGENTSHSVTNALYSRDWEERGTGMAMGFSIIRLLKYILSSSFSEIEHSNIILYIIFLLYTCKGIRDTKFWNLTLSNIRLHFNCSAGYVKMVNHTFCKLDFDKWFSWIVPSEIIFDVTNRRSSSRL